MLAADSFDYAIRNSCVLTGQTIVFPSNGSSRGHAEVRADIIDIRICDLCGSEIWNVEQNRPTKRREDS